jgi:AbrB family transcriptional regulator, transcriptional pleiotropic regulator of transition state genes
MHKRKVTKEGRVNIPIELLGKFRIQENDFVEITSNKTSIIIKKYVDEQVCFITGKVSKNLIKIGNAYISKEGLKILKEKLGEFPEK